jgi:hypothetical protein
MDKNTNDRRAQMDETGMKIAGDTLTTPEGDYALSEITAANQRVHKPLWGPFLLASLGTINLVAAVQTRFWGDWLAAAVMLGGGLLWRRLGTRYILVLTIKGEKVDAWHARVRSQVDRALETIRARLD